MRLRRSKMLWAGLAAGLLLTGCGSGGGPGVSADAVKAQETTCGKWGEADEAAKKKIATSLIEAEARTVTPQSIDAYGASIDSRCYTSSMETPIGFVNAWRIPFDASTKVPDFSKMSDDQLNALMPTAADWAIFPARLSETEDVSGKLVRTHESTKPYKGSGLVEAEGPCAAPPFFRIAEEADKLLKGGKFVSDYVKSIDDGAGIFGDSSVELWLTDGSVAKKYVNLSKEALDQSGSCPRDGETVWTVALDASQSGIPDAFQYAYMDVMWEEPLATVLTIAPAGDGLYIQANRERIPEFPNGWDKAFEEGAVQIQERNRLYNLWTYKRIMSGGQDESHPVDTPETAMLAGIDSAESAG